MNSNEYIITLISNVESHVSLENKVAHFYTELAQPLELNGDWECALSEVMVPGVVGTQDAAALYAYSQNFLGNSIVINVKCDLIEPVIFSSSYDKVLRSFVIETDSSIKKYTHHEFTSLQFYPVAHRVVRGIEIKFTLPNEQLVPFEAKRSFVTLCIRRVKDSK